LACPLGKEVPQEVWDAVGYDEGIHAFSSSKKVGKDLFSDKPKDPTYENRYGDRACPSGYLFDALFFGLRRRAF